MKKFTFIMVAAIAISMASCTAQSPKPSLKNDIDTLSYNFGLARTQGLSDYLLSLGVDSTGAVFPDQAPDLSAPHLKADPLERDDGAEGFSDVDYL